MEAEQGGVDQRQVNVDDEVNDNPIEQVRVTVSVKDDPSEQALTFRTWVLGLISCCALAFINEFFSYRQNLLSISYVTVQILAYPIGKFMAATLPTRTFYPIPCSPAWSFTLNPGPFNKKEHVLITIFAGAGSGGVYALNIVTIVKAYYHRHLNFVVAMLLAQTTQLLGYGWAGLFRRYLVESPYMWWPANLVQVSLFNALHEKEKRKKGSTSRLQFFLIALIASFAYYIIPGYLFPSISNMALLCWFFKDSVKAQLIGSGRHGFGLGSFGLDWATFSFIGNPLATPLFSIVNTMVGFVAIVYVLIPVFYSLNIWEAKRFPLMSSGTYDAYGNKYNVTAILNEANFDFNSLSYERYSKLYMSISFTFVYGFSFAYLMATLSHVALFHGAHIWGMWKKTAKHGLSSDVHTRLMKKYKQVPQWWFHLVLGVSFLLALIACEGFGKQLQLPWWGLLLASFIGFIFTLPVGIIQATTNMQPGLNVITELLIGYIYPGRPLANVTFKTYGYISMSQTLNFIQDFKFGHYMKIPPRSMFFVQLVATVAASTTSFFTTWWLINSIPNICDESNLPVGSPWTCPGYEVFYSASIIWGVIGPGRMFTGKGIYPGLNWFFLIGLLAPVPVWWLSRKYPEKKWIRGINMPVLLGSTMSIPPAGPVHYWTWGAAGWFFNYYVYNKYRAWWGRYNYLLSAALSAGVALMAILLFMSLQTWNIVGPDWWGLDVGDHCPLAQCPMAPGIVVDGCPTF